MEKLVESLTKNANLELDEITFKEIKHLCRLSSENISHAFYLLMVQLRKDHSEIRYIILLAINELFIRSCDFRNLLEKNLEEFLELTLETNPKKPLPPPKAVAERIKCQTQHILKSWHQKFGGVCRRLDLACSYLKHCKNINVEDNQPSTSGVHMRRPKSEQRKISLEKKVFNVKLEINDKEADISSLLIQIENCFQLITLSDSHLFTSDDFSNDCKSVESEDSSNNIFTETDYDSSQQIKKRVPEKLSENDLSASLRLHGISNIKSNISIDMNKVSSIVIEENENNKDVLENLNHFCMQISLKYLPMVSKWIKILTLGVNCTDELKKAIDLKNSLESKLEKFKKLKFTSSTHETITAKSHQSDNSDDDFEEVEEKEGFEQFTFFDKDLTSSNTAQENSQDRVGHFASEEPSTSNIVADQMGIKMKSNTSTIQSENVCIEPSDWQDPELLKDIEAATGVNLKMPEKRTKKGKTASKRKIKESPRTNIKSAKNTTYSRLYKKLFKK